MSDFPHVRVAGDARQRGRRYGGQARERIHISLEAYERAFAHHAAWGWPRAVREAKAFEELIAAFDSACLEEMQGIAEGAAVGSKTSWRST